MSERTWDTGIPRKNRPNYEQRIERLRVSGEVNIASIFEILLERIDTLEHFVETALKIELGDRRAQ